MHLLFAHIALLPSVQRDAVGSLDSRFRSSLLRDTLPAYTPVQASLRPYSVALLGVFPTLQVRPYGAPSHGSGPGWLATPFLYDSFIHYFTPVYPDAIHAASVRHIRKSSERQ